MRRLVVLALLAACTLAGCSSRHRLAFPEETEAWGHEARHPLHLPAH